MRSTVAPGVRTVTDEEVKLLIARIDERTKVLVDRRDDHEDRMRVLEKQVWWFSGGATMASIFLSYVARKLGL
jgi:hypothetical protein